jgi:hypothetical protein
VKPNDGTRAQRDQSVANCPLDDPGPPDSIVVFIPAENYELPAQALRRILKLVLDQANHRSERQAS